MSEERKQIILDNNQSQYISSFAGLPLKDLKVQKYNIVLFFETEEGQENKQSWVIVLSKVGYELVLVH